MATTSPATTRSRRCAQRPQRFRTEATGDGVVEEIQRIRSESSAHQRQERLEEEDEHSSVLGSQSLEEVSLQGREMEQRVATPALPTGTTVQETEEINSVEEVSGMQALLQAAIAVGNDEAGQLEDQNGGVIAEDDADVNGTAQEEASAGETAAASTTDHLYSMRPEQQIRLD